MIEVRHIYRPTTCRKGQLRCKTWKLPFYFGENDGTSPLWEQRAREYWERQEQLFGLVMSNFTNLVEPPNPATGEPGYVSTYSTVLEVLPGERYPSLAGMN